MVRAGPRGHQGDPLLREQRRGSFRQLPRHRFGVVLGGRPQQVADRVRAEVAEMQEQLPGDELLVEFRHRSWLDEEHRAETLSFLESRGLTYVVVDAPKTEAKNLVPTVVARSSRTAYVRFHGRNAATWNKRTGSAADRFDYLYSDAELAEWVAPLRELAGETDAVRLHLQHRQRENHVGPGERPRGAERGAVGIESGGRRRRRPSSGGGP